jgi:hypothetical protein
MITHHFPGILTTHRKSVNFRFKYVKEKPIFMPT